MKLSSLISHSTGTTNACTDLLHTRPSHDAAVHEPHDVLTTVRHARMTPRAPACTGLATRLTTCLTQPVHVLGSRRWVIACRPHTPPLYHSRSAANVAGPHHELSIVRLRSTKRSPVAHACMMRQQGVCEHAEAAMSASPPRGHPRALPARLKPQQARPAGALPG